MCCNVRVKGLNNLAECLNSSTSSAEVSVSMLSIAGIMMVVVVMKMMMHENNLCMKNNS